MTHQPRSFALLVPISEDASIKKKQVSVEDLKSAPASWKISGLERTVEGTLRLVSESEEMRHFEVSMKYKQRSVIAEKASVISGTYEVWQHRNGYAIALDSPSTLVSPTAALLSLSVYGEIGRFHGRTLGKDDFKLIEEHAARLGGVMAALHLRNVKVGPNEMSVYNVTGKNIGDLDKMIKAAKKIKRMGFRIPRLGDTPYYFWVADWGGGTIYQPLDMMPHQVVSLIKFFEDALKV